MCDKVWSCDDLRGEIFSYLRKKPKVKCNLCESVCVWDKKVIIMYHVLNTCLEDEKYMCINCYWYEVVTSCVIA